MRLEGLPEVPWSRLAIEFARGTNLLRNSLWLEIVGPDYIAKAFEYAHEADPDAILRYNDYGLENPAKRRKFIALIKSLQEQKVPVHAINRTPASSGLSAMTTCSSWP